MIQMPSSTLTSETGGGGSGAASMENSSRALLGDDRDAAVAEETQTVKIIVIGEANVGKSSVINRFAGHSHNTTMNATIGVDFHIKTMRIGGSPVNVQVWDTPGQMDARAVARSVYRGSHAVAFTFAVDNYRSFEAIKGWKSEFTATEPSPVVAFLLVGNKCDLPATSRQVSTEEAAALARSIGAAYIETSAVTNQHIDTCFQVAVTTYLELQLKPTASSQNPDASRGRPRPVQPTTPAKPRPGQDGRRDGCGC